MEHAPAPAQSAGEGVQWLKPREITTHSDTRFAPQCKPQANLSDSPSHLLRVHKPHNVQTLWCYHTVPLTTAETKDVTRRKFP